MPGIEYGGAVVYFSRDVVTIRVVVANVANAVAICVLLSRWDQSDEWLDE